MRRLLSYFVRIFFRVRIVGDLTVFDRAESVLVVSRLRSPLDALALALFLPRNAAVIVPPGLANASLMRRALHCVTQHVFDVRHPATLKPLSRLLRSGVPVVVFPEGRIATNESLMKVYPVPALAAARSGATLLPVSVERPGQWLGRIGPARWVPAITLRVLAPARVDDLRTGTSARRRRTQAIRRLTALMQAATLQSYAFKPVFECFLDACAARGRRAVLIEDERGEPQSYGRILRTSLAFARIAARFTRENENVGVLLPNVSLTVGVVLGLSAARRVPAMLNYTSGPRGVGLACAAAAVRTVITSRRFLEKASLHPLLEALAGCNILYLEELREHFRISDKLWLALFALPFPRRAIAEQSVDDPAVVLFTSGSEGRPKGVVLSHRAIIANVAQIRVAIAFTPEDKILNALPLYHTYSFTAGMMLPLVTGTRLYLYLSPLHYRAIPDIFYRHDCTVLFGTSTLLSYYASYARPLDFSRLRYVISGGEKLSAEVIRLWLEKFGLRVLDGYGCTECAPVLALSTPALYRPGTVGTFLAGVEHRLEKVPGIENGSLLHVRGPNLMLGYYLHDRPGVLQAPHAGTGWHNTGDVVDVDEDGFVAIHGRVRRFAKIAGEMVSLDQVEQVAQQASPVHQHAAVLTVQETGGESTVLFTTDPALDRIALQRAARRLGVQDRAVARRVHHVGTLPMLGNGKTDYTRLMESADRETPKPLTQPANSSMLH